jgi:hypothetical protein
MIIILKESAAYLAMVMHMDGCKVSCYFIIVSSFFSVRIYKAVLIVGKCCAVCCWGRGWLFFHLVASMNQLCLPVREEI